jgi:hypothetical protein
MGVFGKPDPLGKALSSTITEIKEPRMHGIASSGS